MSVPRKKRSGPRPSPWFCPNRSCRRLIRNPRSQGCARCNGIFLNALREFLGLSPLTDLLDKGRKQKRERTRQLDQDAPDQAQPEAPSR
jgi:hypothetical protein